MSVSRLSTPPHSLYLPHTHQSYSHSSSHNSLLPIIINMDLPGPVPMLDSCVSSLWANSTNMLHSAMIIDQTPQTRSCLAQALAQQFFGCFISRMSW